MAAALTEAAQAAGRAVAAARRRRRLARHRRRRRRHRLPRRQPPGWLASFPLAPALQSALGTRVALGNDVAVATTAEYELGAGKPYDSLLGVFWGTGVGGGLILDGKPWRGRGGAGEIGHMVIARTAGAARAGAAAAWRPTPGAPRWRRARARCTRAATRPSSSSWRRSTTATASRAGSGSAPSSTATRSRRR